MTTRCAHVFFGAVAYAVLCLPAHAQIPVTDIAALGQLIAQLQRQAEQLATAQGQLNEARQTYRVLTGSRGMQRLLSQVRRNYLPQTMEELIRVIEGLSAAYPQLSADVRAVIASDAVLAATEIAALDRSDQAQLESERRTVATLKALSRAQLQTTSERFNALQSLIDALGSTEDPKSSLDLTARIAAEQTMMTNEANKLAVLNQAMEAERLLNEQRRRERAIQAIGSVRTLPELGLQTDQ